MCVLRFFVVVVVSFPDVSVTVSFTYAWPLQSLLSHVGGECGGPTGGGGGGGAVGGGGLGGGLGGSGVVGGVLGGIGGDGGGGGRILQRASSTEKSDSHTHLPGEGMDSMFGIASLW